MLPLARQASSRHALRKRFRTACKTVENNGLSNLTIYHDWHTFVSHALAGGRTLVDVVKAVGHGKVSVRVVENHCLSMSPPNATCFHHVRWQFIFPWR